MCSQDHTTLPVITCPPGNAGTGKGGGGESKARERGREGEGNMKGWEGVKEYRRGGGKAPEKKV